MNDFVCKLDSLQSHLRAVMSAKDVIEHNTTYLRAVMSAKDKEHSVLSSVASTAVLLYRTCCKRKSRLTGGTQHSNVTQADASTQFTCALQACSIDESNESELTEI